MKKCRRNWALTLGALIFSLLPLSASGGPIPIDGTNFTADPAGAVTFNPDGSATLGEDDFSGFTLLTNAPPNEPQVIDAPFRTILAFSYEFMFGPADADDVFIAVLLESGLAIGAPYEVFIDAPGSGDVAFDLEPLASTSELGIEFSLMSGDFEAGSTVRIANLLTYQVPVPTSFLLLVGGLLGLGAMGLRGYQGAV